MVARFWAKIDVTDARWTWTGRLGDDGYAQLDKPGKHNGQVSGHRFAYTLLVGPIPEGLVIDHLCRNHACVNPDHLEPVTQRENMLRGVSPWAAKARRTKCKRGGHLLAGANLRVAVGRECRECSLENSRELYRWISQASVRLGMSQRAYIAQYGQSRFVAQEIVLASESSAVAA